MITRVHEAYGMRNSRVHSLEEAAQVRAVELFRREERKARRAARRAAR